MDIAGPKMSLATAIVQRWTSSEGSARPPSACRLGAEVLDDQLLDVTVSPGARAARAAIDPILARLADSDEDAARERDLELAGRRGLSPAARRDPCRVTPVRPAALAQPCGRALEHDPHRRRTGRRRTRSLRVITPGLRCGSRPVSRDHRSSGALQVLEGGGGTHLGQLVASHAVAKLRLVTKREQGLATARRAAGASDRQHFVDGR